MADTKLTALTATTNPASTDVVYIVVDPGTTPASKKVTLANMRAGIGTVATDPIFDSAGDLIQGTGADTAAKLSAGTAGYFLKSGGAGTAVAWAARELDYVEVTTGTITITATTEATATTVVTGSAIAFDGATAVMIEFYCPQHVTPSVAGDSFTIVLYDGSSSIGQLSISVTDRAAGSFYGAIHCFRRLTPSAATHTYSIRAYGSRNNGALYFDVGGSGKLMPGYIRITRAL